MTERLYFIGVSTAASAMQRLFPRWAALLGLDAELMGRDLAIGAEPTAYRGVVEELARDERARGALVTTHKVDVYRHASDLFTELDANARLCREVSCISKRGNGLVGHAKDPITAGLALDDLLAPNHFAATGAHALCLGAGGAGTAITVRLLRAANPPAKIVVADTDTRRIEDLRRVHGDAGRTTDVEYAVVERNCDELLARLPEHSLVVNATGMGKDVPGSPLSDRARFPQGAVVWELNYRGDRPFLRQAREQEAERGLAVHDGWRYFLVGWAAVVEEVFGLEVDLAQLAEIAEPFR